MILAEVGFSFATKIYPRCESFHTTLANTNFIIRLGGMTYLLKIAFVVGEGQSESTSDVNENEQHRQCLL